MKYVMFKQPDGLLFPVVFPEMIGHNMIRDSFHARYPGIKPIHAGFCNTQGQTWGKSVSLELETDSGDSYYLKKMFGIED